MRSHVLVSRSGCRNTCSVTVATFRPLPGRGIVSQKYAMRTFVWLPGGGSERREALRLVHGPGPRYWKPI